MVILTIRTDKPEAEMGLYEDQQQIAHETWLAHRQLAETIHTKINDLLLSRSKQLTDIDGIVFYKGPGSFTGLRIGASVASALAYGLSVPIVSGSGDNWQLKGVNDILNGANETIAKIEYGAAPHITQQKK